jgi:hypothetical protein
VLRLVVMLLHLVPKSASKENTTLLPTAGQLSRSGTSSNMAAHTATARAARVAGAVQMLALLGLLQIPDAAVVRDLTRAAAAT